MNRLDKRLAGTDALKSSFRAAVPIFCPHFIPCILLYRIDAVGQRAGEAIASIIFVSIIPKVLKG